MKNYRLESLRIRGLSDYSAKLSGEELLKTAPRLAEQAAKRPSSKTVEKHNKSGSVGRHSRFWG